MGIGPVELNGAMGRLQDVTAIKHNVDNKGFVDQSNIQNQFHKEIDQKLKYVHESDNAENRLKKFDAKEKGNGQYSGDGGQKKKKTKEEEVNGKIVLKNSHNFDIKI